MPSDFVADVTAGSTDHFLTLQTHTIASCVSATIPVSSRSTLGKGEGTPVATELCYPQTYTLQMRSVGAQFIRENWTDPPLTPRVALCSAHHSGELQMWFALRLGTSPLLRHISPGSPALSLTLELPLDPNSVKHTDITTSKVEKALKPNVTSVSSNFFFNIISRFRFWFLKYISP